MNTALPRVTIVGGGLAGSEAAWQLVSRGIPVTIHEMRPQTMTKAHKSGSFAELVCSNSFRGADLSNAVGLLKAELKLLGSLVMEAALVAQVPAGGALAVDRDVFSAYVDQKLRTHPLVEVCEGEVTEIPEPSATNPVIIATGPLTSKSLATAIEQITADSSRSLTRSVQLSSTNRSITPKCFANRAMTRARGMTILTSPWMSRSITRLSTR